MVKIILEDKLPHIEGLEKGEKPLQLLEDKEGIFYLITDSIPLDMVSLMESVNNPKGRLFIGKGLMTQLGIITSCETYRDGGTTIVKFISNGENGEIYVPSALEENSDSELIFRENKKILKKVGYDSPYFPR